MPGAARVYAPAAMAEPAGAGSVVSDVSTPISKGARDPSTLPGPLGHVLRWIEDLPFGLTFGLLVLAVAAGQFVEDLIDSPPLQMLPPAIVVPRWAIIAATAYMLLVFKLIDRPVQRSLGLVQHVVRIDPAEFRALLEPDVDRRSSGGAGAVRHLGRDRGHALSDPRPDAADHHRPGHQPRHSSALESGRSVGRAGRVHPVGLGRVATDLPDHAGGARTRPAVAAAARHRRLRHQRPAALRADRADALAGAGRADDPAARRPRVAPGRRSRGSSCRSRRPRASSRWCCRCAESIARWGRRSRR